MSVQTNTLKPQAQSYDQGLSGMPALLAMIGISLTVLLSALDQTIVGTALPRIVAELHGFDLYAWVATSYLLTSTVMVPIMGKLGDLYGRKTFLLAAIALFVAASLACGAATSMIFLIIARGAQGVGAGMLQATDVEERFDLVAELFGDRGAGTLQHRSAAVHFDRQTLSAWRRRVGDDAGLDILGHAIAEDALPAIGPLVVVKVPIAAKVARKDLDRVGMARLTPGRPQKG